MTEKQGNLQEGIRLFRLKLWDKALKELLSVEAEKFPDEDKNELAYYLGLCYTKLERYNEAMLYLEQVVTAAGDVLRIYQCRLALAYIYIITKRAKMAEYELKKLQNSGFESPQLYNTLAYAAWSRKNNKSAVDLYEKALEIDADNTTAMNGMGYILVDAKIDILRGFRLCRKAVDRKPNNAAYLDSLGWAYYKNGETVEARTWIKRALNLAPDEKDILQHFKVVTGEEE
ncbi:MAG: tetratricopeptide repeat protein [Treponema sp.]|nr:tetratricopeptide repeat protein [Treponema sp.]